MKKKIYKVKNMHCESCASMIELDLEDVGVKAKCSYPNQSLEIEFDEKKLNEEKIKEIVKKSGYELEI
ncbi:heavy-metal-associated domain-containing protein [Candidatus Woesebacteria bacterium]|nr:heavy-metal-associated domain-containing protein [Candidatus Woesebacteria bacterium]QQG47888.1 MAG: heavy-metal-associated domain-containing protein [Candidatus Woesebacteria bacterium]